MPFNTFISSIADLDRCTAAPDLTEVLIEPMLLARQGRVGEKAAQELAIAARARGLRPVLVWDALMPQQAMEAVGERLRTWDFAAFAAVRVNDLGAAAWMQEHHPTLPLHLIAETGNHNLSALQGWCELLGHTLERLILSIELPEAQLVQYCQALPVPCEVLGAGPILLFYSPRSLLADPLHAEDEDATHIAATIAFEDHPDRPFPTVETPHGTLMFLDKDQFIGDRLESLWKAGLAMVRIDLRPFSPAPDAAPNIDRICQQLLSAPATLRQQWHRPTRAPFFNANRTTALIPRMKTRRLDPWRNQAIAEVIAGEGGSYVVFRVLRPFHLTPDTQILLPTGDRLPFPANCNLRTLQGVPTSQGEADQLLLTDWIKKAVTGSLLLAGSEE
ncbi:U32 family peptidase [filamentous cyanobacterium LEGE 07170]|nr:U32 family peptidase [filamentous cyanobacterium LEGE 07170]